MSKVQVDYSVSKKVSKPKQLKKIKCPNLTNLVCLKGNVFFLKLLLDKDYGNVDFRDFNGNTPLHHAAFYGHNNCVDLLLKKGANKLAINNLGVTPGQVAASKGDLNLAYRLHPGCSFFFRKLDALVPSENVGNKNDFKKQ